MCKLDLQSMKILTILGARPQFIKAAAVSRALRMHNRENPGKRIEEVIVHTGQHFDANMSEIFFLEMEIPQPDYRLDINSLGHGAMTGRMLEKVEEVLLVEKPDYVFVYGDTNSTIAGALAAKKLHIPVVHVEAGLRSFNMRMPEEINRILTDRISDILCCPTDAALENLRLEGFEHFPCRIVKTGDVMQDAALYYGEVSAARSEIVRRLGLERNGFILCTIHRAENTDDPRRLGAIVAALNQLSREIRIVLPLHPRARKILQSSGIRLDFDPIEPVGYFDMLELLKGTKLVMTDSGGVQKEAFFFAKPCVTLRDETEWVELVAGGYNCIVGADTERIIAGYRTILAASPDFSQNLYGNGQASARIVELLH